MFNKLFEDMTPEEKEQQWAEWERRRKSDNWVPLKDDDEESDEDS